MKTRRHVKILLLTICLAITNVVVAQPMPRAKAHYNKLNQLVCTCGNILVKCDYTGKQHTHHNQTCAIYKYSECTECGTIWECHKFLSGTRPDEFNAVLSVRKKNAGNKIHEPVLDSCYTDIEELGLGLECHIIKLKDCMVPLYCYIEGENKVYLVNPGEEKSFCKEIGKHKKVHITHNKNSIPGMTIVK